MATGKRADDQVAASDTDLDTTLDFFMGDTKPDPETNVRPTEQPPAGSADNRSKKTAKGKGSQRQKKSAQNSASSDKQKTRGNQSPTAAPEPTTSRRPKARTGRPPGVKAASGRLKDKTSLAIDRDLMDRYRVQSWQEQCQLGELVERALRDYAAEQWGWEKHR